jgi:hypothetical protein
MYKSILNTSELVLLFVKNYSNFTKEVLLEQKMLYLLIINNKQSQHLIIKKFYKFLKRLILI